MLKRHKQRFLGDLHVDQQKLRAQLEVLRSDVEAFAELGDISQVCAISQGNNQTYAVPVILSIVCLPECLSVCVSFVFPCCLSIWMSSKGQTKSRKRKANRSKQEKRKHHYPVILASFEVCLSYSCAE